MAAEGRHSRLASIDWFSVDRVQATRAAVIGAGAVGNEVVKNLVLLGVGHIDIFDFDRIELHNLPRSVFYREADVGAAKADVLASRAGEVDPGVTVRGFEGDFRDTLRLRALRTYDVAFGCVDNFEARVRLSQMCRLVGTDLVNAGIDSRYATVETFPFRQTPGCACYECHLPESAWARIAERYSCGWLRKRAWEERRVPTTPITASVAGAHAVSAGLRLGSPSGHDTARRLLADTIGGTAASVTLERSAQCIGCAGDDARPALICAKRSIRSIVRAAGSARALELRLSDPVITGGGCVRCGLAIDNALLLRRAADFDDALMVCPECRMPSVRVDIRDVLASDDLAGRFPESRLGARYVLADTRHGTVCIELEGEEA